MAFKDHFSSWLWVMTGTVSWVWPLIVCRCSEEHLLSTKCKEIGWKEVAMVLYKGPRLLEFAKTPPHLQFNKYVLTGYRPVSSAQECLRSLFYMHNELGNIYTHGKSRNQLLWLCLSFSINLYQFMSDTLKLKKIASASVVAVKWMKYMKQCFPSLPPIKPFRTWTNKTGHKCPLLSLVTS